MRVTVYVDELADSTPYRAAGARWRFKQFCHLWADSVEELHEFAARIGMRREWFQPHRLLPHYDLTATRRREAIRQGAQPTSVADHLRRLRA